MKYEKKSSASALERFGRDRRTRTSPMEAGEAERRPRSQRDAADSDRAARYGKPERRASYNPNFTDDNRPKFDSPRREERRSWGDRPRSGDRPAYGKPSFDERPRGFGRDGQSEGYARSRHDEERPRRAFGDRRPDFGDNDRFGGRPGRVDKPRFGGDKGRFDGDGFRHEERPRFSGSRPARDEQRAPKRFGSRPDGERRYGDRSDSRGERPAYGERRYGDRSEHRGNDDRRSQGGRRFSDRRQAFGGREERPSYPKYNPEKQIGEMRLNRFLAQSGICSRREADDFITAGLVTVNGKIVTELGSKVLPTDEVKFNDSRVQGEKKVYLVLNKPKGYVTSSDDPHAEKTVMELVAGACTERIYPVGRLDKNSLGLLLFTNDGDLTKQLTHPSHKKKKIYQVTLDKPLTRADMDRLAEGITLEDGEIYADEISYVKENKQEVGIEIHSGRNRIVRRMFEFLGYAVTKLDRVYYAGLTKKNLNRGRWRFLTDEEVARLKSGQYE